MEIENLTETIMVGDRKHDVIGAQKQNLTSVGVLLVIQAVTVINRK